MKKYERYGIGWRWDCYKLSYHSYLLIKITISKGDFVLLTKNEELIRSKRSNRIFVGQRCKMSCDNCTKEFERVYGDIEKRRKSYENKDLCNSCMKRIQITNYNKSTTGKTLEERLGKERAEKTKNKIRSKLKGENNPNYGGKYSRFESAIKWNQENLKGKTFEEAYGEDKAKEIKQKLSIASKGEKNNMYGKPSPQGSGNGWQGWYKGTYFASLKELFYLKYLMDNNIQFENGEQEKYRIQYEFMGEKRNYFLDFYLPELDIYIEIKPKKLVNSPKNTAKFKAAREILGSKFKILTEDDIEEIDIDILYELYLEKEIIFVKKYEQKFIQYYRKQKREEV